MQKEFEVVFTRPDDSKENKTIHGTAPLDFNNMVVGVTEGFQRIGINQGLEYRAQLQGTSSLTVDVLIRSGVLQKKGKSSSF